MGVLIGTDGSDDALAAATQGLSLLAAPESVTIVCIVETPAAATAGLESGFAGGLVSDAGVEQAWAAVQDEAEVALERTAAALSDAGLASAASIEKVTRTGEAGPAICRLAEEIDADVIVVGSRGRGALKRALLGSVSSHVTNNAPCPVVVVRAGND